MVYILLLFVIQLFRQYNTRDVVVKVSHNDLGGHVLQSK
jgi:hypothetical protein